MDQNDPNYDSEDDPYRRAADAEAARTAISADGEEGGPVGASGAGEGNVDGDEGMGGSSSRIVLAVNKLKEDVCCAACCMLRVACVLCHEMKCIHLAC